MTDTIVPELRPVNHEPQANARVYGTHFSTLGRQAILDSNRNAHIVTSRGQLIQDEGYFPDFDIIDDYEIEVQMGVNEARGYFLTLTDEQKRASNDYLQPVLERTVFNEWANSMDPEVTLDWTDILGQRFSDDQILNFLQWNVHRTAKAQEKLDTMAEAQKAKFADRVERAVADGHLPKTAEDNLSRLSVLSMHAGDIFDTLAKEMAGYFCKGEGSTGGLVVAAEAILYDRRLEEILTHEMTHAISGREQSTSKIGLKALGHHTWLNEAMTEHITQALVGKTTFDKVYPFKRKSEDEILYSFGTYVEERELLFFLSELISMDELLENYFAAHTGGFGEVFQKAQELVGSSLYKQALHDYGDVLTRRERKNIMQKLTITAARAKHMPKANTP